LCGILPVIARCNPARAFRSEDALSLGRAASLSAALHALALLVLLAGGLLWPAGIRAPPVLAEVELVVQNTPTVGPAPSAPASQPNAPRPSARERRALLAPRKLPAPPPLPPAPPRPPARFLSPRAASGTGLVSGPRVVPAAIDKAVRNVPPSYPPEAVAEGEQGSVILMVHVAATGAAAAVDVARSSGYALLDEAARAAVARWRFLPARHGPTPVPSTMPIRIRFVLTNPESGPNSGSSQ